MPDFARSISPVASFGNERQPLGEEHSKSLQNKGETKESKNKKPKYPHYALKPQRVETFATWPDESPIKPEELAEAGLYYVGNRDCVRCYQCGGEWMNWKVGDKPLAEHKRSHPICLYLCRYNGQDIDEQTSTQNLWLTPDTVVYDQASKIETPKYPQYTTEQQRKKTFDTWPADSPVKPEELIKAGLYYVGIADIVRCFFCDGELKSWRADDKPFEMHKQSHPNCPYIRWKSQKMLDRDQVIRCQLSNYFSKDNSCNRPANMVLPRVVSTSKFGPVTETKVEPKRVDELEAENQKIREKLRCKLCHKTTRNVILLPCGHYCICQTCVQGRDRCVICQNLVHKVVVPET